MNADILDSILGCPALPSLPAVAARVVELASQEDVSLDELADTIQTDQALAAKVLRTVNSSYYGLRTRVGSIRKAISMLGLGPVKSITLGFSLVSSLADAEVENFDFETYWRRALYSAAASRHFAEAAKIEAADEVFLAALMQDVGMVAMQVGLGDEYTRVLARSEGDHRRLIRCEIEDLEATHADIGAMLCERWRLPDSLVIPVKYHERATAAPHPHSIAARCVALGTLVYDVLTNPDRPDYLRHLYAKAFDWVALRETAVDELIRKVTGEVAELGELFQLDAGSPIDANEILVQATNRMMELERDGDIRPATEFEGVAALLLQEKYTAPRTMALNARGFEEALRRSAAAAHGGEAELTLLIIGIDGHARLLDEVGSPGMDRVELGACTLLRKNFEPFGGLVSDLGKGRFGVIIFGVGRDDALRAADLFRKDLERVAKSWFEHPTRIPIAVSIGAVTAGAESRSLLDNPADMVTAAARAMATSQAAGGNRVQAHAPAQAA